MKSLFIWLSLAIVSFAQLGNIIENIGEDLSNAGHDIGNSISNGFEDIGESIDSAVHEDIVEAITNSVLPGDTALFVEDLQALFEQARNERQVGANSSAQTIEIMDIFNEVDIDSLCGHCTDFADELKKHNDDSTAKEAFVDVLLIICKNNLNSTICTDAVQSFLGEIYDAIVDPSVNSTYACQRLAMCPYNTNNDTLNPYVEDVLSDKPATNIPNASNSSTYLVLHMTDLHIDFHYEAGSWAQCGGYQCCRSDSGAPPDPSQAAGYWGTLATCDIPVRTYEQFLKFASKNFNISFILWTGDNIDHEVWQQEQSTQTAPTDNATQYLKQYFPNTTIYPMFGNHEGFFSDQFDTTENGDEWLLTELGAMWEDWFNQETLNEFEKKSYYSVVNQAHNLKIISLDTQTCDTLNFDLIKDSSVDPLDQLEWLREELSDAENRNLTVFIMGHIPPGSLNCDPQWSSRYRALVDRFTNIIRGQFYGHTHNDQFEVVRSYNNDSSPVGVIYVAPSLTTYTRLNPSFRIFEVDSQTNQIVDYRQYRLNLTKWNQNTTGDIEWDLAYTLLDEYNMTDTSYASFDSLADRIKNDNATAQTYAFNYNSGGQSAANLTDRTIDYLYCGGKYSEPHQVMNCLGLNASMTNLEYFASQYVPGMLPSSSSGDNSS